MSMKCTVMDREVPELMGVSKAILENVIFCHQDDSNWPLSDNDKELKKRFDEIFAATGYRKALENLKKLKTSKAAELKTVKEELNTALAHLEFATKLKTDVEKATQTISNIDQALEKLNKKIEELDKGRESVLARKSALEGLGKDLQLLEASLVAITRQRDELYDGLEVEYEEDDTTLADFLKDEESHMSQIGDELVENKKLQSQIEKQDNDLAVRLNQLSLQEVQVRSEEERYAQLAGERTKKLLSWAQSSLPGGFSENPTVLLAELTKKHANFIQKWKEKKEKASQQLRSLSDQLNKITGKHTVLSQTIKLRHEQVEARSNQISSVEAQLREADNRAGKIAKLETQLSVAREKVKSFQLQSDSTEVAKLEQLLEGLEQQKNALSTEMKQLSSRQADLANLVFLKSDRDQKQATAMLARKKIDGADLSPNSTAAQAVAKLQSELEKNRATCSKKERKHQEIGEELAAVKAKIELHNKDIEAMGWDIDSYRKKLNEAGTGDLERDISHSQKKVESTKSKLALSESKRIILEKFLAEAQQNHHCPLCLKGLGNHQDQKEFENSLEHRLMEVLQSDPKLLNQNLKERQANLDRLLALRPIAISLEEREKSREDRVEKLEKCQREKTSLKEAFELLSHKLTDLRQQIQHQTTVLSQLQEWDRLESAYQKAELLVNTELKELRMADSVRTIADVQKEYDVVAKEYEQKRQLCKLVRERNRGQEEELRALREEEYSLNGEISHARELRDKLSSLKSQMKELETQRSTAQEENKRDQRELDGLKDEKNELETKRRVMFEEQTAQEQRVEQERTALTTVLNEVNFITESLNKLDVTKLKEKLNRINADRISLREERKTLKTKLDALKAEESAKLQTLNNREKSKRLVQDTLRYRKMAAQAIETEKKLEEKRAEWKEKSGFSGRIEDALAQFNTKREAYEKQKAIKEQLITTKTELDKHQYADADDNYRTKLYSVTTRDLGIKDVDKYYKAVDKALMKYHTTKMEDINHLIKELWSVTYRGTDIDTIEIRAEPETTGKRDYKYRVVMMKGGIELDMKGRCSAGQKVLASLVIRMALAETFCIKAGILALDEPTTNLDRYNVESFANALNGLIKNRREQSNFQLIIITHDEEFVQLLGSREQAGDYFWRVSKDANGYSLLERQAIGGLGFGE